MQRYINQLIQDLQAAKKNVPQDPQLGTEESYEEFEAKMFAIETAPNVSSKQLYGVSFEELPPKERLTEDQMQQLYDALVDTMEAFNCSIDFPEGVPLHLRYEMLRDTFAEPVQHMPGFTHHYDFCSGWCPDCKLIDYCNSWKETWTKEEIEQEKKK